MILSWAAVILITIAVSLPVISANIYSPDKVSDYKDHILFARDLLNGNEIPPHILAHAMLQGLTILGYRLLQISLENVTLVIMLSANLATSGLIFAHLRGNSPTSSPWLAVAAAACMLVASPIALFFFQDQKFYLGYIGIISYHNPTIILLRPLALLNFLLIPAIISSRPAQPSFIVGAFVTSALAAAVKPSLAICVLPVLALAILWSLINKQPVQWGLLIFGFVLPTAGILGWQYGTTYGTEDSRIIWAPLEVMHTYAASGLLPRFLLSIWFPLLTLVLFAREVRGSSELVFAWLVFLAGSAYTYLLAESGLRFIHGNFGWSGEIGLFLLFIATLSFLVKQWPEKAGQRNKIIAALLAGFCFHLFFGLLYYYQSITTPLFF